MLTVDSYPTSQIPRPHWCRLMTHSWCRSEEINWTVRSLTSNICDGWMQCSEHCFVHCLSFLLNHIAHRDQHIIVSWSICLLFCGLLAEHLTGSVGYLTFTLSSALFDAALHEAINAMHIACGICNGRSFILVNHLVNHQTAHGGNTHLSSFLSHLNYDHAVRPLVSILIYTILLYPMPCCAVL